MAKCCLSTPSFSATLVSDTYAPLALSDIRTSMSLAPRVPSLPSTDFVSNSTAWISDCSGSEITKVNGPFAPFSLAQPLELFSSVSHFAIQSPPYWLLVLSTSAPLAKAVRLMSGAAGGGAAVAVAATRASAASAKARKRVVEIPQRNTPQHRG